MIFRSFSRPSCNLGITPNGVIQMLYSQIVLHNGIPFDVHILSVRGQAGIFCYWNRMCMEEQKEE